jgi:YHS domain-containing protein
MMKWMMAVLGAVALLTGQPAHAHDVKDPVCRMTVDSDTAKFKHKLGNKSFYFCSKECQSRFGAQPEKYEKLAAQLERQELHEYQVDFKTAEPAVAGEPVQMEFAIRYKESGELVREFEVVHERLLHLLMTTSDLAWFEHQHPVRGKDGRFRFTWTFRRPGTYRLYADFTPSDGDNQVKPLTLTVGGGEAKTVALRPDRTRVKQVGDLRFELKVQGEPLRMEKPMLLTYTVRDRQGRLVCDMQPFIGAPGHLIAISQDGKEVVHTHALQAASHPSMSGEKEPFRVTQAMVTEAGPAFSFKLTAPTGGLYKTWAQFMWNHRVYTVPFTFQVADLWGPSPAVAKKPAAKSPGVQRATIVVDGQYQPGQVRVKAGRPVELTFVLKERGGCGDVLQFPSLKLKRTLRPDEKTTVSFTPQKSGTIAFTCGMNMYRGQVLVQ